MEGPRRYTITLPKDLDPSAWVHVEGGGLAQPIEVRIDHVGLRVRVVDLRIVGAPEITSSALRTVRLGEITDQLSAQVRRHDLGVRGPWPACDRSESTVAPRATLDTPTIDSTIWFARVATSLASDDPSLSRGRGASPPTVELLERFAQVYLDEIIVRHRGAISRTSRRLHMDRSTARRWIAQCRDVGLLPSEEEN